jgi:hypothetical protein
LEGGPVLHCLEKLGSDFAVALGAANMALEERAAIV